MSQRSLFEDDPPEDPVSSVMPIPAGDPDGLRYYQREAFDKINDCLHRERSALLVMATGLGKSRTIATVGKHWDGNVLYLAHRDELVYQLKAELEEVTGELVEVEKADLRCTSRSRIVVASSQTLGQQHRLDRLGKGRFSLVVQDEAHHALAPSFRRVLDYFDARVLGCTATPDRTDEVALGQLFDEVAFCFDIVDGIDAGYLVPIRGKQVVLSEIDISGVDAGKSEGGLAQGQLDEAMLKAVEGIVVKTLELEPNRQGIMFFPGVKSAEFAAERFNALRPGSASFVSGGTPHEERKRIMSAYKAGKTQYLCNCQIATEGFDAPRTSLIGMGRPTTSRSLYAQMAGRGTRVLPGTVDSVLGRDGASARRDAIRASQKSDCIILDFVGNAGKHSLVSPVDLLGGAYTEIEVDEAKKRAKKKGGGDIRAYLEEARRELRALAEKTQSQVKAQVSGFDPFKVLNLDVAEEERYAQRFGYKPITPGQFDALLRMKVPESALQSLSQKAASKLIEEAKRRSRAGLCTFAMQKKLQDFGIMNPEVTYERASAAMGYLSSTGWGRKNYDPLRLERIVNGGT